MSKSSLPAILLVEDSEDHVFLFKRALSSSGAEHDLHVVSDGVEAVDFLEQQGDHAEAIRPELIVLDINMPRMNGFETLEYIKGNDNLNSIPVVMLTSSVRKEDVTRSYRSGACTYVSKPISFDEFCRMVGDFSKYWTRVATLPPLPGQG